VFKVSFILQGIPLSSHIMQQLSFETHLYPTVDFLSRSSPALQCHSVDVY